MKRQITPSLGVCAALLIYAGMSYSAFAQAMPDDPGLSAFQLTATATLRVNIITSNPVEISTTYSTGPIDESMSVDNGDNEVVDNGRHVELRGIDMLDVLHADNRTHAEHDATTDSADTGESLTGLSLLGGLVKVDSLATCAHASLQGASPTLAVNVLSEIARLNTNGVNLSEGQYAPGKQLPVSGLVDVPVVDLLGIKVTRKLPFTGSLFLQANDWIAKRLATIEDPHPHVGGELLRLQGIIREEFGRTWDVDIKVGTAGFGPTCDDGTGPSQCSSFTPLATVRDVIVSGAPLGTCDRAPL